MLLERTETYRYVLFGSNLLEVQQHLTASAARWPVASSHRSERSMDWDFNAGWHGAVALARDGWSEGAVDLADRLNAIPPSVNTHYETKFDVAGYMPDVPRYLSGNPAHMITRGKRSGSIPVVHIVINTWVLAGITAEEFKNYGAAMLAMIDKLESTGRRVELDVLFVGLQHKREKRVVCGWKVKCAHDHADLSAIAFSLAHPAAFRRFGFAMVERSPAAWYSAGYGINGHIMQADADAIGAENAFLLDGVGSSAGRCRTMAGAMQFAAEQINKAAGETLIQLEG